jgi:hypothetical protein
MAKTKRRGKLSRKWCGCEDLSGEYFAVTRCSARKRGLLFEITIEQAWGLFQQQGGRCALTGRSLSLMESRRLLQKADGQTASLDRIDSTKGYVPGNVWWVHKDVNMIKKEYPLDKFLQVCEEVARHRESAYGKSTSNSPLTTAV